MGSITLIISPPQAHHLFVLLNLQHAFVTEFGKIVGCVTRTEVGRQFVAHICSIGAPDRLSPPTDQLSPLPYVKVTLVIGESCEPAHPGPERPLWIH